MKKLGILLIVVALAFGFPSLLWAQPQAEKKEAGDKMEAA